MLHNGKMMYGSEQADPVVKYYDQAFAVTASDDVAWFVNQAEAGGGPVLDLACGTGRIAIELARAGLEVVAVDESEGMLSLFGDKLGCEPSDVRSRIRIVCARMSSFELSERLASAVCCDAFFHNLTVDDQIDCLTCVAEHLAPGGSFAFNIRNPTLEFLSFAASSEGAEYSRRDEFSPVGSTDTILIEQAQDADMMAQLITTSLRFTRLDEEEEAVSVEESSWISRFTYRFEAIHLLHRCGFVVESLVGDYRGGPVKEDSQLIFVARLLE